MTIELDHVIVSAKNQRASARMLAELLGVRWAEAGAGPFSPVYVNDGLTLDFIDDDGPFPVQHFCFRVSQDEFDSILKRLHAAGIKYRLHPSIDMLVARLPKGLQWSVRWLNHALVLGLCLFMAWFGTRFAIDAWSNPSPVLRLPLTWLYGPVAFCFALMALRYLQVLQRGPWAIAADRETNVG